MTSISKEFVVLTNLVGGRGIDYLMEQNSFIIMVFEPSLYSTIQQALSRGCRRHDSMCEGVIIFSEDYMKITNTLDQ